MLSAIRRRGIPASAFLFSVAILLVALTAGCSGSDGGTTAPPTSAQNYVSANGAFTVGGETSTFMVNIGAANKASRSVNGLVHAGVNTFIRMTGTFDPDLSSEIVLQALGGAYSFVGQVAGTTINGTFSEFATQTPLTLAATDIPIEAAFLLGPWDFTHSLVISTASKGIDACSVPVESRTLTAECSDRYQIQADGNNLPAGSCTGTCLPDLDMTTGTLDGATFTIFVPEVGETQEGRIDTLMLQGCSVAITGDVEIDAQAGTTKLVNLDTACIGDTGCEDFCTAGKLDPDCVIEYALDFTKCEGGSCACPG